MTAFLTMPRRAFRRIAPGAAAFLRASWRRRLVMAFKALVGLWMVLHLVALAAIPAASAENWVGVAAARTARPAVAAQPANGSTALPGRVSDPRPAGNDMGLVPDGGYGEFPLSHYEVTFKHGHSWDIGRNLIGGLIVLVWSIDKMLVGAGLWVVGFAFDNSVIDGLRGPFLSVGRSLDASIVGPLHLASLTWFVLIVVGAWHALRGRVTMAAGEIALSVLAAGLFGLIAANPAGYLQGALDTTGRLSSAVLSSTAHGQTDTSNGDPRVAATIAVRPAQAAMFKAFIDEPYQVIQWGHVLSVPKCAAINRWALGAVGYSDAQHSPLSVDMEANADSARGLMKLAGCTEEANWANNPSAERLGSAVLSMFVGGLVLILLGLLAFTVITSVVILACLFAAATLVAPCVVLPGAGRAVLWRWVAAVVRVLMAVVGMALLLVILSSAVTAFLTSTDGQPPIMRFLLVMASVVFMFVARKRIIHTGSNIAQSLGDHLSSRRPGSASAHPARWLAPAAAGAATGLSLGRQVNQVRQFQVRHQQQRYYKVRAAETRQATRHGSERPATSAPFRVARGTTSRGRTAQAKLHRAQIYAESTLAGRTILGSGRSVAATGRAAKKVGAGVYKSTVGLPVHGPRAARAVQIRGSARYQQMRSQLGAYGQEYRRNLRRAARPISTLTHLKSERPAKPNNARPPRRPPPRPPKRPVTKK